MAPVSYGAAARVVVISLIALVLIQGLVALAMLSWPGRQPLQYSLPLPNQIVSIIEVMEHAQLDDRARILAALNSPTMAVELLSDFPPRDAGARDLPMLQRVLRRYTKVLAAREFRIDTQRFLGIVAKLRRDDSGAVRSLGPLRMMVRLNDGSVLQFTPSRSARFAITAARIAAVAALLGIVVVIAFVVAIRQTSRPVQQLALAARRFGTEFDASELPVTGPREIRDLSIAFNDMKRTIRGLVDERTRILAAIAHDMRTYLTRLRLRVDFIADPEQNERAARDLDEMTQLLEDTLLYAREITNDAAVASTSDVAATVREICAAKLATGANVSSDIGADVGAVTISSMAFKRVLDNLIDNAIRYGDRARVSVAVYGREAHVIVDDDGPGIPAEEIDRVMRPFERLEQSRHRATGGSGLGLAIVNALVHKAGGYVQLENRTEGGLRCTVALPRAVR
ncbi:MAG: ATP-binding protein [Steroidobacteraceae bacterium]